MKPAYRQVVPQTSKLRDSELFKCCFKQGKEKTSLPAGRQIKKLWLQVRRPLLWRGRRKLASASTHPQLKQTAYLHTMLSSDVVTHLKKMFKQQLF